MMDKRQLPKYVSINGDKYRYREYLGVVDGKGWFGPSRVLASIHAPMSEVWAHVRERQGRVTGDCELAAAGSTRRATSSGRCL